MVPIATTNNAVDGYCGDVKSTNSYAGEMPSTEWKKKKKWENHICN